MTELGRRFLWVFMGLALVLRIGFGLTLSGLTASSDEVHWDGMARSFWLSGVLHPDVGTYRPPLYPLMLSGIYRMTGYAPIAARIWQALIGTATCVVLYKIGQRIGGERVGVTSAVLGSIYPLFIFFSGVLMAETLLVFLTVSVLLLVLRFESVPTVGRAGALGAVLGLSALCKPILLPWVALFLLPWWCSCRLGKGRRFIVMLVAVGSIALMIAPWTLRNALVTGYFVPISSNVGINLIIGNEPGSIGVYQDRVDYLEMFDDLTYFEENPVVKDRLAVLIALNWIFKSPIHFLRLGGKKFLQFWSPLARTESLLRNLTALFSSGPLIIIGGFGVWKLRNRPEGWVVASMLVSLSLIHTIFFVHTRFRLPADAMLIGPAAYVMVMWWKRIKGKSGYAS